MFRYFGVGMTGFPGRPRSLESLVVVVAVFLTLPFNIAFWARFSSHLGGFDFHAVRLVVEAFFLFVAVNSLLVTLVSWRPLFKPTITVVFVVTSAVSYFMRQYGIIVDSDMISNVFATDVREATDLLTIQFVLYVVFLGVLPSWLLWRIPVVVRPWRQTLIWRFSLLAGSIIMLIGTLLVGYQELARITRSDRALRFMMTPPNYLYGLGNYVAEKIVAGDGKIKVVGKDARQVKAAGVTRSPRVVVFVVGETARADHFSINGYQRPTTPELARLLADDSQLINLGNFRSCGTATGISLPCMFSDLNRESFSERAASRRENVLDVVQRAGVSVLWIDNNSGCKGICARTPTQIIPRRVDHALCTESECFDEILVERLGAELLNVQRDTLIVLHQMGSHGPAYYKRYPKAFERFTPVCESSQFDRCELETVVNAYDNTIVYADHVVSRLIEVSKVNAAQAGVDVALFYVSDHGESLGESGLFLHGMPYAIAPDSQTHVPALLWLSEGYSKQATVDMSCMQRRRNEQYSHDNVFHLLLGFFDIQTTVRDENLDMLMACRGGKVAQVQLE